MSDTLEILRRKIEGANDLASVVHTMKAMAAASIGQYESAVSALGDYSRTVELGLSACFRRRLPVVGDRSVTQSTGKTIAIVFGSDQGLVGQFNEVLADFVATTLNAIPGQKNVWSVGERMRSALINSGLPSAGLFALPNSVTAITSLIGQILEMIEANFPEEHMGQLYLFHHHPKIGAIYEPLSQRLLPLDAEWQRQSANMPWPTKNQPEVIGEGITGEEIMGEEVIEDVASAFIREYLFTSLFQACAESLASENASRLSAMQRAEKNIADMQEDMNRSFHRLRQSSIDEELFDVISGFEAQTGSEAQTGTAP